MQSWRVGRTAGSRRRSAAQSLAPTCSILLLLPIAIGTLPANARADIIVWLDFNTTWVTSLDTSATGAGVAAFNATERAQIESNILAKLQQVYSAYKVTFTTTDPGGTRDRINFGATGQPAGTFGSAPLDFRNDFMTQTSSVYAYNFGPFIETGDTRSTQIAEISASLGGTAAHELGHSLGLRHHHAYGTPEITPANYANTGGLQNQHILATGSTGISEIQRESVRTFSQWENVVLEAALGLTNSPLAITNEVGDAGSASGTAQSVALTSLAISQTLGALVKGRLSSPTDIDMFSFTVASAGRVTAEVMSDAEFADDFDSLLRLFSTNGTTLLAENDDTYYNGNVFNSGVLHEEDSFLLNIWLPTAGTYYFQVSSAGAIAGDADGDYYLLFAFDAVPEPSSVVFTGLAFLAGAVTIYRRRRTRAKG